MIKSLLATSAVVLTSVPAFAGAPGVSLSSVSTPYGQFGCIQRAQNKFFAIGATSIDVNSNSVWAYMNGITTIGVWCRGSEAIISVSGENEIVLKNEIKSVF